MTVLAVSTDTLRIICSPSRIERLDERLQGRHGGSHQAIMHLDIQTYEWYDPIEQWLGRANRVGKKM